MSKRIVYSFDVFDTCLSRTCSLPVNVFYIMAGIIYKGVTDRVMLYEFVNARLRAEHKAKKSAVPGVREDPTLEEIYDLLDIETEGFSKQDLIRLELETEDAVLRPVNATMQLVTKARNKGARIIFVSDMYLPFEFIQAQLQKHGFIQDGDGLYVSCKTGLKKVSGNLYDHIRDREKIQFSDWTHFGDNPQADLHAPKAKGISAHLVETGLNKYEYSWNNNAFAVSHPMEIYFMSGIAKSLRLSANDSVHESLVVNAIAPLFVPFVAWILKDARKRGIRKLYFIARDGYVLHQIALILGKGYPEIELRYLYGSRRAFYLPGIKHASREEFRWIMGEPFGRTPRQMLKRINADVNVLAGSLAKYGKDAAFLDAEMDIASYETFLDLLTDETSRENILQLVHEHRDIVKEYFRQEGLYSGDKAAVVDIGWSRFCQRAINVILAPEKVFSYYFGVFEERLTIQEAGDFAAAFYPEEFYIGDCNKNLMRHEFLPILEQFFTLNGQLSTIGFARSGNAIVPLFEDKKEEDQKFKGYLDLHLSLIRKFAEEYQKFDHLILDPENLIRNCGYRSVTILMNRPERAEAEIFGDFMVDNGVGDPIPLVTRISLFDLISMVKNALKRERFRVEYIWTEGTYAYSFGVKGLKWLRFARRMKELHRNGIHKTHILEKEQDDQN